MNWRSAQRSAAQLTQPAGEVSLLSDEGQINKGRVSGNTITGRAAAVSNTAVVHVGQTGKIGTLEETNNNVNFETLPAGYESPRIREALINVWKGAMLERLRSECAHSRCSVEQVRLMIKVSNRYEQLAHHLDAAALDAIFTNSANTSTDVLLALDTQIDELHDKWKAQ